MFNRIVIGVDEHEGASDAIALGKRLIAPGGRIMLAFVYSENPYVSGGVSALYEADERERTLQRLRQAKADARSEADMTYILSTSPAVGLMSSPSAKSPSSFSWDLAGGVSSGVS
jgi:hypothetical protein